MVAALTGLHVEHTRDGQMCWCDGESFVLRKGRLVRKVGHTRECLTARKALRPYWRQVIEEVKRRRRSRRKATR